MFSLVPRPHPKKSVLQMGPGNKATSWETIFMLMYSSFYGDPGKGKKNALVCVESDKNPLQNDQYRIYCQ